MFQKNTFLHFFAEREIAWGIEFHWKGKAAKKSVIDFKVEKETFHVKKRTHTRTHC